MATVHREIFGSVFVPREKIAEFDGLVIKQRSCEIRVKVEKKKSGAEHHKVMSFLPGGKELESSVVWLDFRLAYYGDLFLSKMDRTCGADFLYQMIRLGFVYDRQDIMEMRRKASDPNCDPTHIYRREGEE